MNYTILNRSAWTERSKHSRHGAHRLWKNVTSKKPRDQVSPPKKSARSPSLGGVPKLIWSSTTQSATDRARAGTPQNGSWRIGLKYRCVDGRSSVKFSAPQPKRTKCKNFDRNSKLVVQRLQEQLEEPDLVLPRRSRDAVVLNEQEYSHVFAYLEKEGAFNQPGMDAESMGSKPTNKDIYKFLRGKSARWCLDRKSWFQFGHHMTFDGVQRKRIPSPARYRSVTSPRQFRSLSKALSRPYGFRL